jgi:hypothetical protein
LTTDKLEFPADHKFEPYIPASTEALLERFDKEVAEAKKALAKFAPEKWDENWKFVAGGQAWIDDSKYRGLPRLGSGPPDSPPRPVGRLPAPAQQADPRNLWAVGGRDVERAGNFQGQLSKAQRSVIAGLIVPGSPRRCA